jgi:hypothetical protein
VEGLENPPSFVLFNSVAPESENCVVVEVAPGLHSSPQPEVSQNTSDVQGLQTPEHVT